MTSSWSGLGSPQHHPCHAREKEAQRGEVRTQGCTAHEQQVGGGRSPVSGWDEELGEWGAANMEVGAHYSGRAAGGDGFDWLWGGGPRQAWAGPPGSWQTPVEPALQVGTNVKASERHACPIKGSRMALRAPLSVQAPSECRRQAVTFSESIQGRKLVECVCPKVK